MLQHAERDLVALRLSRDDANRAAATLRLRLALELEREDIGTVPERQELERTRGLLDHYCRQLDTLQWGESDGDVDACFACGELRALVEDLRRGASDCRAIGAREDGAAMERTASVLVDALDQRGRTMPSMTMAS